MVLNKKWLFGINFSLLFSSVLDILSSANDEWQIIQGITISCLQQIAKGKGEKSTRETTSNAE